MIRARTNEGSASIGASPHGLPKFYTLAKGVARMKRLGKRWLFKSLIMGLMAMLVSPVHAQSNYVWEDEGTASVADNIQFHDIWGRSDSDVYAVGNGGTVLHHDGSSWSKLSSGTTADLHAVWGPSSGSDAFVVGKGGAARRCTAGGCSQMNSGTTLDLYGVWAALRATSSPWGLKGPCSITTATFRAAGPPSR